MTAHYLHRLLKIWRFWDRLAQNCGTNLREQPRVTESASAHHNHITARIFYHFERLFGGINITVAHNGNGNRLLDAFYNIQIDGWGVHLLSRSAVNDNEPCACLLGTLCDLNGGDGVVVPTLTNLYRDGNVGGINDSLDNFSAELRVF